MNRDIVDDLWSARLHDSDPWDATLYERATNEIEHLRSLIVYWCDVVDDLDGHPSDYHQNVAAAEDELRKAVGR